MNAKMSKNLRRTLNESGSMDGKDDRWSFLSLETEKCDVFGAAETTIVPVGRETEIDVLFLAHFRQAFVREA